MYFLDEKWRRSNLIGKNVAQNYEWISFQANGQFGIAPSPIFKKRGKIFR
jgi:hypothetical protein